MQQQGHQLLEQGYNREERVEKTHLYALAKTAQKIRKEILGVTGDLNNPVILGKTHLSELAVKFYYPDEPLQVGMNSAEQHLQAGKEVSTDFHTMIEYIAHLTKAEFKFAELKTPDRITEKAEGKYAKKGRYDAIRDTVRASLDFDNLKDLYKAVKEMHGLIKIVHAEDTLVGARKSGYMDLKLIAEFKDADGNPYLTEIQLHLKGMRPAQENERKLYLERRGYEDQLQKLGADDAAEKARLEEVITMLQRKGISGYEAAAELLNSRHSRRLH